MHELKLDPTAKFCHVDIIAFMEIPKSWSKVKRLEAEYGAILPTTKPDIDNIIKSALDGCEGVVYYSDNQVTSVNAKKVYCHPARRSALYGCILDNIRPVSPIFFPPCLFIVMYS